MRYKSGESFELKVLGPRLGRYEEYRSFSECALSLIKQNIEAHPDTRIGKLIYYGVKTKLDRAGVDTSGLVLINSVGHRIDYHHETDAFFFLPMSSAVATIDLFNIDSGICHNLRHQWDSDVLYPYGESEFQSEMYSCKKNRKADDLLWCHKMFALLKQENIHQRPENHFILTPYHTEFRENRERFCRLVADFFIKSSKKDEKIA